MITENRLTAYINSLDQGDGELIEQIAETAVKNRVPIIRRETAALLKTMVTLVSPARILEVGTAVGYSALLMASVMPKNCRITTIEKYEKRIRRRRKTSALLGWKKRSRCWRAMPGRSLRGFPAPLILSSWTRQRGQYINWLPDILRLLRDGGLLMSDNVLQDGTIMESRYAVERRDRTIHERMREYLYTLKHMDEFETSILPVGDGVALSVKKGQERISGQRKNIWKGE